MGGNTGLGGNGGVGGMILPGFGGGPAAVGIVMRAGVTTLAPPPASAAAGPIRLHSQRLNLRGATTCSVGAAPICLSGGITP